MRPRLPSELTTRTLHGFVLTGVAPIVGIALDVYLIAVVSSTNWVAYVAANALVLGLPLGRSKPDDESGS